MKPKFLTIAFVLILYFKNSTLHLTKTKFTCKNRKLHLTKTKFTCKNRKLHLTKTKFTCKNRKLQLTKTKFSYKNIKLHLTKTNFSSKNTTLHLIKKIFLFKKLTLLFQNRIFHLSKFKFTYIFCLVFLCNVSCFLPSEGTDSDKEKDSTLATNKFSTIYGSCSFQSKTISYTSTGKSPKLLLVFVHGSPGSWDNFKYFLNQKDLISKVQMVSFDRLGYGNSKELNSQTSLHPSNVSQIETSLTNHAMAIIDCLKQDFPNKKWILVGHSYGGPVVAKISMIETIGKQIGKGKIAHLVLVASSIDPNLEKKEWFNSLAEMPLIQWILPEDLITSNTEILELKKELLKMIPDWDKITSPTTVIHGRKDSLVPFENVEFAKRQLVHSHVKVIENAEWNHFIPWSQKEELTKILLKIIQDTESN